MKRIASLLWLMLLVLPCSAWADGVGDFGLDAHASTLGLGGELNYSINSYVTARVDFNRYNYNYNATKEQIAYNFGLHLKSYSALVDFHPFAGSFRLTAGYLDNQNEILAVAVPQGSYTINGHTYSASQVGTLTGDINFNSGAPYFGLGWTTLGTTSTGIGVSFDLGVVEQGTPKVQLSSNGPASSNSTFKSDLAAEQTKVQGDLNSFKSYPVVAFGLVFRF